MSNIEVPITPELEPYAADIRFFFELMVRKLHTNRHKGFADAALWVLRDGLIAENEELRHAVQNVGQFEAATEAADVANMALLMAIKVLRMTRADYKRAVGHDG